jgi:hypothetical protein
MALQLGGDGSDVFDSRPKPGVKSDFLVTMRSGGAIRSSPQGGGGSLGNSSSLVVCLIGCIQHSLSSGGEGLGHEPDEELVR